MALPGTHRKKERKNIIYLFNKQAEYKKGEGKIPNKIPSNIENRNLSDFRYYFPVSFLILITTFVLKNK